MTSLAVKYEFLFIFYLVSIIETEMLNTQFLIIILNNSF